MESTNVAEATIVGDTLPAPQSLHTPAITPPQMLAIAVEQGADLDKLERFMDLSDRYEAKEAEKAFSVAMAEFRRSCPPVYRTSDGQSNKYASLSEAAETIRDPLADSGLSYRWETGQSSGLMRVTCVVTHIQGHSTRTSLESALDTSGNKNGVQAIGSTVSYLERYTLFAALGLSSRDMDNDGADAPHGPDAPRKEAQREARPQLPAYDQDAIHKNWLGWQKLVVDGNKTPAQIIANIKMKATLTDEQEAQILDLESK